MVRASKASENLVAKPSKTEVAISVRTINTSSSLRKPSRTTDAMPSGPESATISAYRHNCRIMLFAQSSRHQNTTNHVTQLQPENHRLRHVS